MLKVHVKILSDILWDLETEGNQKLTKFTSGSTMKVEQINF